MNFYLSIRTKQAPVRPDGGPCRKKAGPHNRYLFIEPCGRFAKNSSDL